MHLIRCSSTLSPTSYSSILMPDLRERKREAPNKAISEMWGVEISNPSHNSHMTVIVMEILDNPQRYNQCCVLNLTRRLHRI